MGLDMYLSRKHFIWSSDRGEVKITGTKSRIDGSKVKYIIEEAGYWRKANQIHNWFVNNVQGGEDDCKPYYVDKEDLQKLLDLCKQVKAASKLIDGEIVNGYSYEKDASGELVKKPNLEKGKIIEDPSVAKELLPTGSGFFFGSTDYDEWYLKDIDNTIEILEECLSYEGDVDYEYESSW